MENILEEPESKKAWDEVIGLYGLHYLQWNFPKAGSRINPHSHKFEHSTVLIRGTFIVYGDAECRAGKPITAPDVVIFKAGSEHSIIALTDGAICMHFYPLKLWIMWIIKFVGKFFGNEKIQDFGGG